MMLMKLMAAVAPWLLLGSALLLTAAAAVGLARAQVPEEVCLATFSTSLSGRMSPR